VPREDQLDLVTFALIVAGIWLAVVALVVAMCRAASADDVARELTHVPETSDVSMQGAQLLRGAETRARRTVRAPQRLA
jgi:uncharacterized membrane protein